MKIQIPFNIHNRFKIERRKADTGFLVQEGFAENIVLNNFFTTPNVFGAGNYVGNAIQFGNGTGELSPARTTLFNRLGGVAPVLVEKNWSQVPTVSYTTKKGSIAPGSKTGEVITEVGLGDLYTTTTIYTHALIKDSEGNPLTIGPIAENEEVLIYETVFMTPMFGPGITLYNIAKNALLSALTAENSLYFYRSYFSSRSPMIVINGDVNFKKSSDFVMVQDGAGRIKTPLVKFTTSQVNEKIKTLTLRDSNDFSNSLELALEVLAENDSALWGGYNFDNTQVGVGDGTTQTFNLTWDEAWLEKPKKIYADGVEVTSGVTWTTSSITFDAAPGTIEAPVIITADYWVKYAPKDSNHEFWIELIILYGEGA